MIVDSTFSRFKSFNDIQGSATVIADDVSNDPLPDSSEVIISGAIVEDDN